MTGRETRTPAYPPIPPPATVKEGTEFHVLPDMARTPWVPTPREPEFEEFLPSGPPPLPLKPNPALDETVAVVSVLPEPAAPSAPAAEPAQAQPGPRMPSSIFGSDLPSLTELASAGTGAAPRLGRRNVIGWNNIRWGVAEEELKRRFGEFLSKYDRDAFEAFRADLYLKDVRYFSLGFDVIFQMSKSNRRLAQVLIDRVGEPNPGDFEALYATMRRIYGVPTGRDNFLTDTDVYFRRRPDDEHIRKGHLAISDDDHPVDRPHRSRHFQSDQGLALSALLSEPARTVLSADGLAPKF